MKILTRFVFHVVSIRDKGIVLFDLFSRNLKKPQSICRQNNSKPY